MSSSKALILAKKVFGQDIGALTDRTTRSKPLAPLSNYIKIPPELIQAPENAALGIKCIWVDRYQCLTTSSLYIIRCKDTYLPEKLATSMHINDITRVYGWGGFTIHRVEAVDKFKPLNG
jgi:hypothetical protein